MCFAYTQILNYDAPMKEDMSNIQEQLSNRTASKINIEVYDQANSKPHNLFILSESDLGVIRNGGRRGSAYGPKSIISTLKKMTAHKQKPSSMKSIRNLFSSNSFSDQQEEDTKSIQELLLAGAPSIWHLGGGHDHIYPLLSAINSKENKILVINIDAHLDTRADKNYHSGTPFRQFANEAKEGLKLIQLGIHDFANERSNYEDLAPAQMEVYSVAQIRKETSNFSTASNFLELITKEYKDHVIVLSLDADAICAESMEAVSAVNHNGLEVSFIRDVFSWYYSLSQKQKYCGIYEYNPIFDNLSNKGSRIISSLIAPFL